jgi:hypothetical protein
MKSIKGYVEVLNMPNSELNFREKLRKFIGCIIIGIFGIFLLIVWKGIDNKRAIKKERRNKLKYFKPSIEEGLLSNRTTWVMRDTPLTEGQLDDLFKSINNI